MNRIRLLAPRALPLGKGLALYLFYAPFFLGLALDFLGLPGALKYTLDAAWCALTAMALLRPRLYLPRQLAPMACLVGILFVYTFFITLFQWQSGIWYLWGIRNNFRFFAGFFAFAALLDREDADRCFRFLDGLFWVHIALCLVQFFLLGIRQDYLGGIFGLDRGDNAAYSILFFSVYLSRWMLAMMNGQAGLAACAVRCAAALMVAALAELFGFFLIFAMLLLLSGVLTRFSWRKCLLLLGAGAAFFACSALLLELFGEGSRLTPQIILRRLFAENYATDEDLGRLTAIPTLSRTLMRLPRQQLFGLGLGNCDTSAFALCTSDFYRQYSHLHYTWFLSAFLFLETGYVGLGLYLALFLTCLFRALGERKRPGAHLLYSQMGVLAAALCMVLTFYNSALRSEAGYMAWFALALPWMGRRQSGEGRRTP